MCEIKTIVTKLLKIILAFIFAIDFYWDLYVSVRLWLTVPWLPDAKYWLIGKYPDAWKDCRWEEKGTTEDEVVGWHHWLNGHEFG